MDNDKKIKTLLECYDDANCDKGKNKHYYNTVYEQHFEPFRYKEFNFLEIGILKAVSVDAHLDYFPNAKIYAIDTFERKPPEQIRTCNEPDPRFKWLQADSSDPDLTDTMRQEWGDIKFDLIVDDGAHWYSMMRKTFERCSPMLSDTGKYFIEDMWPWYWMTDENRKKTWQLTEFPEKFNQEDWDALIKSVDHMEMTHYDCRVKPKNHRVGHRNPLVNRGRTYLKDSEWMGDSTIMMLENK